jgi:Ni/Fe-hydrogenase 1 B-type cytochrome subunit
MTTADPVRSAKGLDRHEAEALRAAADVGLAHEAPATEDHAAIEPVYVWDAIVRGTHWVIVFTMILLSLTGIYIARPFLSAAGPAHEHFATGWIKVIHFYSAIAFSLAVGSRILWMFLGPRRSGWRQFVPVSKRRRRDMVGTFKFYVFLRPTPPSSIGHNPLAGATYLVVFLLYLLIIFTGFAMYSVNAHTSYMKMWDFLLPIFHGPQGARWLHHATMWLLIGFVVHHIYSALLTARVEKNGTLDSIFSGYKYLRKDRKADDE